MIYVLVGGGALNAVSVPHLVRARLDPAGVSPEGVRLLGVPARCVGGGHLGLVRAGVRGGGRGGVAAAARAARR